MQQAAPEPGEIDEALAWRDRLTLRLIRGLFVIFLLVAAVAWTGMAHAAARTGVALVGVAMATVVAVPAITGRPRAEIRAWFILASMILGSLAGYALVGPLSGPGVCLLVTLMMAGLLLGRRAMVGIAVFCALAVAGIGWAMVSGRIPAPDPIDVSMVEARTWARSGAVAFMAIALFGGLMVTLVERMERGLRLAKQETLRREQAERARAEAELMALESKQLETVGRLAAGVAHDFNNNLTAIIGSAELLKMDLPQGHESTSLADGILTASNRLAELTRQLLAYSRKARMLRTPTDLHLIVNEAVSLLRRSIDPNIKITTELNAQNATVVADAALLQSAILNLLVNARDAMPDGGTLTVATTSIELTRTSAKGSMPVGPCVVLEVIDSGRGISKEQMPHIFEPFFTTKPVGKGTGLGLAAVAGTVKAHGGSIEVNSDVDVGTAFRIYLPLADTDGQVTIPPATAVVQGQGEILLIEDDAMVSVTAVATLQSFGYAVTHVADGDSGLEQVRAHPGRFGLVVLDLRMPGLSGEATFEKLHELEPQLPILIWSGYGAEQDVAAMLKRGAVGFVQKPYRVADLSRTVAENIRRERTLR